MKTQHTTGKLRTESGSALKPINTSRKAMQRSGWLPVVCLLLTGLFSLAAAAEVPMPKIPKGKGDKCMDDTDVMRTSHMDKLLHKRDRTMYQGIRTEQFSLKECISCHVVLGADNQPVNATSPKHFCRVCHDYAAVKIDCFECHASKPRPETSSHKMSESGANPAGSTSTDITSTDITTGRSL